MNINSTRFSDINFGAKMKVCGIDGNEKRWENIAKIFEEKTQKYEDTFELATLADDKKPYKTYTYLFAETTPETKYFGEHYAEIYDDEMEKILKNNSDEVIANKFVKMLKIFRHEDKQNALANKFINKFAKYDKFDDHTNFEHKFWDILGDKLRADSDRAIDEDSILSQFKVY